MAGRGRITVEGWTKLTNWLKVFQSHSEEFAIASLPPEGKKQFDQAMKVLKPLWERFDQVTKKELIPALADGQMALVVDAKLTGKQWIKALPATRKPLPMLEPALVVGLSDSAKAQKAFVEYRAILNELGKELPKINPMATGFHLPAPQARLVKDGVLYFYSLPADLELDPRIMPNVGVSDKVAVLTMTREHSERLFTATPLQAEGFLMENRKRPLSSAAYIHWAGLVDVAATWIDNLADVADKKPDQVQEDILKQVRAVCDVLRVFRSSSSISYVENGASVTRGETRVRDLP
jgi:hypothetical protein